MRALKAGKFVLGLLFVHVSIWPNPAYADVTQVSSGFIIPETITPVPSGFGPAGAAYIIPDAATGGVYTIQAGGGLPTELATAFSGNVIGGTFLPGTYGPLGGQYLVSGAVPGTGGSYFSGTAVAVNSVGAVTPVLSGIQQGQGTGFTTSVIAPNGFGAVGGTLLVGSETALDINSGTYTGSIDSLSTSGSTLTIFSASNTVAPYGLGFAPQGFGAFGGDLFFTSGFGGNIYSVNDVGQQTLFASLDTPFVSGQITGLRNLAFAPAGFGAYGGDLFVSVSGSQYGGGTVGSIVVINAAGNEVADINQGTLTNPLDPRGLYFLDATTLLVANADPGIDIATPASFSAIPEPPSGLLMASMTLGMGLLIRNSNRRESAPQGSMAR